jgi:hypothetical protein
VFSIRGVVDGEARQGRRDQKVVAVEHAAERVEDFGAHDLVRDKLRDRHSPPDLVPVPELRREIVMVVAREVNAVLGSGHMRRLDRRAEGF